VPFYRSKGRAYNAWLIGVHPVHFLILLPLQGSPIACFKRLKSAYKLGNVHAARDLATCVPVEASPRACRPLDAIQIPV
jgi:hypothetical protein